MTKMIKTKAVAWLSRYDFDGETLATVRDAVARWINTHGESAKLDFSVYDDGDMDITIQAKLEETDDEYARRLERESAAKDAAAAKELALFKQLQAKYGNQV